MGLKLQKNSLINKCFNGKWSEPISRLGGSRIVEAFIPATEFNSTDNSEEKYWVWLPNSYASEVFIYYGKV